MNNLREERLYSEKLNKQNCLMRIIEYTNKRNVIVEFQDKYKIKVHTQWCNFINGSVKNPYYPSVYGVGITGIKYKFRNSDNCTSKEYDTWKGMLRRCFD